MKNRSNEWRVDQYNRNRPPQEHINNIEEMDEKRTKAMEDIIDEIKADRKKHIEELKQTIASSNELAMFADGHDDALAGWSTDGRAIYFIDTIIGTLMERDGMSREEAIEFFDFNIAGAYVGEYTPIYMYEE